MIGNVLMLAVLIVVGIGAAARDAWLDRTPRTMAEREPWWLRKANAPFWVHARTKREQARNAIAMEAKR